jgi:response regulator RpfG family c-di-GMP phosphodiesterase
VRVDHVPVTARLVSLGRRLRSPRGAALLTATIVAALTGIALQLTGVLDGSERQTVAARFQLRDEPRPKGVVVVAIDDVTFSDLKLQWPFPRSLHGKLIDHLHAAGAKEIVYDVQFTEPTKPAEDMALYRAIGRAGGAVLATTEVAPGGRTNVLGGDDNLAAAGAVAASSSLPVDGDGVKSRFEYKIDGLRSLAVVTARRAGGPRLTGHDFPSGGAWIDYRGGPDSFPTVSFSDVVRGRFDPAVFKDAVVVVGATAPSLQDIHATPAGGGPMSGPELEANAIWTALHDLPLRGASLVLNLLLILVCALLPALAASRLRISQAALAAPVAGFAYLAGAQVAFEHGVIVAVVAPIATLIVSTVATVVASHAVESSERRRVADENEILDARVRERTMELHDAQLEIVRRLALAAESRDEETGDHIDRISRLCYELARAIGLPEPEAELLRHASVLHDVGKIGIPDRILLKPGKLDPDEWETMKTHAEIGASILAGSESPLLQQAEEIALTHHERWDGSGYPGGMAREDIPLAGRICAICDVFDALLSERPYKRAWPREEALAEIREQSGSHFDPALVDVFLALEGGDDELEKWAIDPSAAGRNPSRDAR